MFGRRTGGAPPDVWIVVDDSPDAPEPVLAVLATEAEARAFVDEHVPRDFAELAYAPYRVGWTFSGRRYRG